MYFSRIRNPLAILFFAVVMQSNAKAALLLSISEGARTDEVIWTFSGEAVATGFGFFSGDSILESEPVGIWGGFSNFTTRQAVGEVNTEFPLLDILSGSVTLTHLSSGGVETTANVILVYYDDGATGDDSLERIGFGLDNDIEFDENDRVSISGTITLGGAGISDFNAGGLPYLSESTAFGGEPNNLPLTLSIGAVAIPEPSSVVAGLMVVSAFTWRARRAKRRI